MGMPSESTETTWFDDDSQPAKPEPADQIEASRDEYRKRYRQSLTLLGRCVKALRRQGWEDGETTNEVLGAVETFLSYEKLEQDWIKKGIL